jgi:hypothetical protein
MRRATLGKLHSFALGEQRGVGKWGGRFCFDLLVSSVHFANVDRN